MALLARLVAGRWALPAAALALFATGFAAGHGWRGIIAAAALAEAKAESAQCAAARHQARADGAEAAAAALTSAAARARAAMETLAKREEIARATAEQFRRELSDVPETYICGSSAAERAYRRSVTEGAQTFDFGARNRKEPQDGR
jgi:hypothetical protein